MDLVRALAQARARFLIVGAYAMAVHGVPRATGDLDVWVEPTPANAGRVWRALSRFGAPLQLDGVTAEDLATPGTVYQLGVPPRRIDIMTAIDGVRFPGAWKSRVRAALGTARAGFLGREALLRNKTATGRTKDKVDIELLRGHGRKG